MPHNQISTGRQTSINKSTPCSQTQLTLILTGILNYFWCLAFHYRYAGVSSTQINTNHSAGDFAVALVSSKQHVTCRCNSIINLFKLRKSVRYTNKLNRTEWQATAWHRMSDIDSFNMRSAALVRYSPFRQTRC